MIILFILIAIVAIIGIIKALEVNQKPLPAWYKIESPFRHQFFRILRSISRFILTFFWDFVVVDNFGDYF